MFAKSLADLEVRSQLVWQNKGENSLQRAINSKEGGAARPEGSTGPCPRLCPLLKDTSILSHMLWTSRPRAWPVNLITLEPLGAGSSEGPGEAGRSG